jgi:hypothetical protein
MISLMMMTLPAVGFAIPFINFGFKGGVGTSLVTGTKVYDQAESTPYAVGGAARFDLAVIQLEANLMYQNIEFTQNGTSLSNMNALNSALIGRFDISPIPFFKLTVGSGVEQRYILDITSAGGITINKDLYEESVFFSTPFFVC